METDRSVDLDFALGEALSLGKALSLGNFAFSGNLDFLFPEAPPPNPKSSLVEKQGNAWGEKGTTSGTPSSEGHSSAVDVDMVKTRGSPCEKDGLTSMQGAEGSEALGQNLFKIPDTRGVITAANDLLPFLHSHLDSSSKVDEQVVDAVDATAAVGSDSDYNPAALPELGHRRSSRLLRASTFRSVPSFDSRPDCRDKGRKVGRPIAYRGDPNSPALTEDERRRVKRRIANRESARRVRQKRQDQLGELQIKMQHIQAQNQKLGMHCNEVEEDKRRIMQQLEDVRDKWETAAQENMRLQGELAAMRKALEINIRIMEATGKAAAQAVSKPVS